MWFAKEKVFADTLDSFFKKNNLSRVRLLKIDTEGSESCVIKGGYSIISKQAIDFVALEYHPGLLSDEEIIRTHEMLKNAGYILTQINGQTIYHLPGLEKEIQGLGDLRVNVPLWKEIILEEAVNVVAAWYAETSQGRWRYRVHRANYFA